MSINYLSELKKILSTCEITKDDPYYDIYEYIRKTQRDLKILLIIDDTIMKIIESRKRYLEKELKRNSNGKRIDYDEFPIIGPKIQEIITNQILEYEILDKIQGNEKLDSTNNKTSKYIAELETRIYEEVLTKISDVEKMSEKINTTKPREEQIRNLKEQIEQKCIEMMKKIEINNKKVVQDNKINIENFRELYDALDPEIVKIIKTLEKIETQKMKIYSSLNEQSEIIGNVENIFYDVIIELINEKIKNIDEQLLKNLKKIKYKQARKSLIRNKNLIEGRIEINQYLPDYIAKPKFDNYIYEKINIRCRLMELKNKIEKKKTKNEVQKNLTESEKIELKLCVQQQIENTALGTISTFNILPLLKEELKKFKTKKVTKNVNLNNELTELKQQEEELLVLLKNKQNIKNAWVPKCANIMTPLEAIYVYNVLKNINESGKNIESYRQLIDFVMDDKIKIVDTRIKIMVQQTTIQQFEIYFKEISKQINSQKILKIGEKK